MGLTGPRDSAGIGAAALDGQGHSSTGKTRLAWWISRLMPAFYARTMKRRLGAEFEDLQR
jgi:hypothetical protein